MGSQPTGRTIALAVCAALLLVIAACSDDVERGSRGEIVEEGNLSADRMRIGDCFNDWAELATQDVVEFESVAAVPCAQAHDNEVFASFLYPAGGDAPFPGDDALFEFSDGACFAAFRPYVGRDYETSMLDFFGIVPTSQSWNSFDDREILCALYHVELQQLRGTMKGSGR